MAKNILITGSQGYIGSRFIELISNSKKYNILSSDIGYFSNCNLYKKKNLKYKKQDIRQFDKNLLEGIDYVVHLAALSNDPLGNLNPKLTYDINLEATERLAHYSKKAGVKKFLFMSSCIMYGESSAKKVNEKGKLNPQTDYAKSKALAEKVLSTFASDNFQIKLIRNGTIFGISQKMRFDTVLNDFLGQIYMNNKIVINGNGKPIRPVVHLDDVCRTLELFMMHQSKRNNFDVYNNGSNKHNLTIKQLALKVAKSFGAKVEVLGGDSADKRTYKADFTKFSKEFKNFKFRNFPENSSQKFLKFLSNKKKSNNVLVNKKFTRLKWLKHLLSKKIINKNLKYV